jgi:biopolymer transport protein ExbB/TolQ
MNSSPTHVGVPTSTLLGVVGAVAFYAGVVYPLRDTYSGQIFLKRGPILYIETFFAFWSIAFMLCKLVLIHRQRKWYQALASENQFPPTITPDMARYWVQNAANDVSRGRGFLARRLAHVFTVFGVHGTRSDVVEAMKGCAETDANAVESSYGNLRIVIWSIPIIGFIGTVIGLGTSIRGFADSSAMDLNTLKSSLSAVTSGLSIAFDSTFVALSISLLIMFPASYLERLEVNLLITIDGFLNRLLVRLESEPRKDAAAAAAAPPTLPMEAMAKEFAATLQAELRVYQQAMLTLANQTYETSAREVTAQLQALVASVRDHGDTMRISNEAIGDGVNRLDQVANAVGRAEVALAAAQTGMAASLKEQADMPAKFAEALATFLARQHGMNQQVLQAAGERLAGGQVEVLAELQRIGEKWGVALQQASATLAETAQRATAAAAREQQDKFAEVEAVLNRQNAISQEAMKAAAERMAAAQGAVLADLQRIGQRWGDALSGASETLAEAAQVMTEASEHERQQKIAEYEVFLQNVKSVKTPARRARRQGEDGQAVASEKGRDD